MKAIAALLAFLFLKTGEKFATQEAAGPTVAEFTACVAKAVGDVRFEPGVFNRPADAVEFCGAKKPAVGIVTPGFYLAYHRALNMEPLLEVRRQGVPAERYVVAAMKTAPDGLDALQGKVLATALADEERFVVGVILQDKVKEVRLKAVGDVEGAAFDLVEGAKGAADAVLMEEAMWEVIRKDEELGPKLKAVFRSEELPRALVVVFRDNAGKLDFAKLRCILSRLHESAEGRRVMDEIRVEAFEPLNGSRLKKAQELFLGKCE
ncbi:MAG: phosphate/phosphite/phosphonate ABC transporter substrate-binding protein [Verrucomicrobiae bacterium]|nr:phosphate/phosphite/phosphonate ABC transporter substrate-binding protein [Verrucomicrobiae bacterium]